MTKVNISSGDFELISSNSIIYYEKELPIDIDLLFNDLTKISIRIANVKDETGKRNLQIDLNAKENKIEYKCMNFNGSFGTGTSKPIEFGTMDEKKMFIHFWIYEMGSNDNVRKIEYSIWKEK